MACYMVMVVGKGLRKTQLQKALGFVGPNWYVDIQDGTLPASRAGRFAVAVGLIATAKEEAKSLRNELESRRENLPKKLIGSVKAAQLEEAISQLNKFISGCEQAEGVEVDFRGVIGRTMTTSEAEPDGWLCVDSWAGRSEIPVKVLGRTPKLLTVKLLADGWLPGGERYGMAGQIVKVPVDAVREAQP
jgi:hypothetical protein